MEHDVESTARPLSQDPRPRMEAEGAYDPIQKTLHWAIVALLLIQALTKLIPKSWTGEDALNAWHVAVGPSILALAVIRLFWRWTHPVPPPPSDLSPGLRLLSRANHAALYALLILIPVLGWVSASAFGVTPYLFGLIPLPAVAGPSDPFGEAVGRVHGLCAWLLLIAVALHVAGALYHLVIKRDGVFQRMLPARAWWFR